MYRTLANRLVLTCVYPKRNLQLSSSILAQSSNKGAAQAKSESANEDVKFDYVNKTGIILLNKPKALNALTLDMIYKIYPKMKEWESDGKTKLVIIKSTTPKAFCAGGDVKSIWAKTPEGERLRREFFYEEYKLNYLIGTYKLPYVAFINGITMGGGCGISVHGSFRVATETTTIAMPETAIGLFPDVGGSHFLPHLPSNLGVFLGLTGHRLRGIDNAHAGIATHFSPMNKLDDIEKKLIDVSNPNHQNVKAILDQHAKVTDQHERFSLQRDLPLINELFSIDIKSVEDIFDKLRVNGSEFALKQLSILEKMSPTSLKLTFEQIKRGRNLNLKDCLIMEYRMVQNVMNGHDFFEGVRAVLVDKDQKPQWKPSSLKQVTDSEIAQYFEKPSSSEDLQLQSKL